MNKITIITGDGRIWHPATIEAAVSIMRQSQERGDRYATVWGLGVEGNEAVYREAGYIGASERDCNRRLDYVAGRTAQVLGHDGQMASNPKIERLGEILDRDPILKAL